MKVVFYSAVMESGGDEWTVSGEMESDADEKVTIRGPEHWVKSHQEVDTPDGRSTLTPADGAEFVYACYHRAQRSSYSKAVIVNEEAGDAEAEPGREQE